jgi:hypothetical protein
MNENMIKYRVSGSIVNNDNVHSWQEVFKDENPITARQKAINRYKDILIEIEEAGEKIEKKITTGDSFDEIGLGIAVYLEIDDPFDEAWNGIDSDFTYGIGKRLYESAQEWIDEEWIDDKSEFPLDDYSWAILGIGFLISPHGLLDGLKKEMKIYDFFKCDKENNERGIPFFDNGKNQMLESKILQIPFDWTTFINNQVSEYNSQKIYESNAENKPYLDLIQKGEDQNVEFKATLNYCKKQQKEMDYIKLSIAKTIAAFLNTRDGYLFIGVNDNGEIEGLEDDYNQSKSENKKDSFRKTLSNIIRDFLGKHCNQNIKTKILTHNNKDFMVVEVTRSSFPVTLKDITSENKKKFFIRSIANTEELDLDDAIKWILEKFKNEKQ